ncbi:MAG: T9SS type A sorting domain-containing protein [Bacteroidales bacterium]|jgi:poly(3-hydroxybutyrate) depolymerase|nr:T9SS type A sorting domain-containing protein [Bacteroidales bacterium]
MKKFLLIIFIAFLSVSVFSQNQIARTITWGGVERTYIEIAPADVSTPLPVMFLLHGLGDTKENMATVIRNERPEWIYIVPQAKDFTITGVPLIGTVQIGTAWNMGGTISVTGLGNYPVNPDIDDSGFLMKILDSLENNYNIDTDSVFFSGFSLGGFMTNRMALEHSDRITGIASVSGTIGKDLTALPTDNLLALHIHGTSDEVINYNTGNVTFNVMGNQINSNFGKTAEETVEYWRAFNNCDATPITYTYPSESSNNLTFERYYYLEGDNESRTAFIKVINGVHNWYMTPIDYFNEIIKFFKNQWETEAISLNNFENEKISIYPNPTSNNINIRTENENLLLEIFDIIGSKVFETHLNSLENNINISKLNKGIYLVKIGDKVQNIIVQ